MLFRSTVRSRSVELRLEPVPRAEALHWLQEQNPQTPQETLQAAYIRSGGFLGQAQALLQGELQLPQTTQFAQAFAASDRYAITQLLASMEKLPRDKFLEILIQWKQLLADAMLVRAGMPGSPEATELANRRTAIVLVAATTNIQKAMEHCAANIGTGHICGWLAVTL